MAQARSATVRLPHAARAAAMRPDAGDRLRQSAGRPALHRLPGARQLLLHGHITGHPAGRAAHPDRARAPGEFPHLALVSDLTFGFLPAAHFSVVHAHSVFSHSPRHVIAECLSKVGRVMAPGAFFDFTFHRTAGSEHHLLGWAFYYRSDTLLGLARSHGLDARIMTDWKSLGGPLSKMRVTAPPAGVLARSVCLGEFAPLQRTLADLVGAGRCDIA